MCGTAGGGVVCAGVGPLAQGGLDEAFRLPVGLRGMIGASVAMVHAHLGTLRVERPGAVAPAVVKDM